MKAQCGLIIMVLIIGAACSVTKARNEQRWELSVFTGALFGGEFSSYVQGYGDTNIQQDNSSFSGVRAAYFFTPHCAFETTWGASKSAFYLNEDKGFFDEKRKHLTDFNLYSMSGAFVFTFMDRPMTPFFDFGAGINVYDVQDRGLDSHARWFFDGGIGIRSYFSRNLGLRFDLRGYLTYMDWQQGYDESDYSNDIGVLPSLEMSVGLMLLLP